MLNNVAAKLFLNLGHYGPDEWTANSNLAEKAAHFQVADPEPEVIERGQPETETESPN